MDAMIRSALLAATLAIAVCHAGIPAGWPQFLGPTRNAVSPDTTKLARTWPTNGPVRLWSFPLNTGFGGPAVQGSDVYITDRDASNRCDILYCLDFMTGQKKWEVSFDAPGNKQSYPGTRSTPSIDDEHIYFTNPFGCICCVGRHGHTLLWRKNLLQDYGGKPLPWEFGHSPLLLDDRVIVWAGGTNVGVVALKKSDGSVAWTSPELGELTYASPMTETLCGTPQILMPCAKGLASLDPANGSLLWLWGPWPKLKPIAAPIPLGNNRLFINEGYDAGYGICDVTKTSNGSFAATTVFTNSAWKGQLATPILVNDQIFATGNSNFTSDGLMCLDKSGMLKWKSGKDMPFERGSFILADGMLVVVGGNDGMLFLVKPEPAKFELIAKAKVASGPQCWAVPVLVGGKLLLRSQRELICLDLAAH